MRRFTANGCMDGILRMAAITTTTALPAPTKPTLRTLLLVRNPKNNNEVIVKVTDRGPHTRNRLIDLSYYAAERLDIIRAGVAKVEVTKIDLLPEQIRLIPVPKVYMPVSPLRFLNPGLQSHIKNILSPEKYTKKRGK